jgi:hypothetical protein
VTTWASFSTFAASSTSSTRIFKEKMSLLGPSVRANRIWRKRATRAFRAGIRCCLSQPMRYCNGKATAPRPRARAHGRLIPQSAGDPLDEAAILREDEHADSSRHAQPEPQIARFPRDPCASRLLAIQKLKMLNELVHWICLLRVFCGKSFHRFNIR